MTEVPAGTTLPVGQDTDVSYAETVDFKWTELAFTLMRDGALVSSLIHVGGIISAVIEGPCPRCRHRIVERWVDKAITGNGAGTRTTHGANGMPTLLEMDITCRCGGGHANAPQGVTGCGATFRIALQADDGDGSLPT